MDTDRINNERFNTCYRHIPISAWLEPVGNEQEPELPSSSALVVPCQKRIVKNDDRLTRWGNDNTPIHPCTHVTRTQFRKQQLLMVLKEARAAKAPCVMRSSGVTA